MAATPANEPALIVEVFTRCGEYLGRWLAQQLVPNAPEGALEPTNAMMTIRQAAEYLGMSRSSFHQKRKELGIPVVQLSDRRMMYSKKALDEWIEKRSVDSHRPKRNRKQS